MKHPIKARPFFRWYDLWVGVYVDTGHEAVYICPLPSIGIKIWREQATRPPPRCTWRYEASDMFWTGDCGAAIALPDDTFPAANDMAYCFKCGRLLEERDDE